MNKTVIDKWLCFQCGTCAGVCPLDAISLIRDSHGCYHPEIDLEKCNNCGLCLKVCPGFDVNIPYRTTNEWTEATHLTGQVCETYMGFSNNDVIRINASSGGAITSLLAYALDTGMIDGALVTRMRPESPLEAESLVVRTSEELSGTQGSKYIPVPSNIALRTVIEDKMLNSVGIVGLPCQIRGIRKACDKSQRLRKKVKFTIGLFCKQTKDLRYTLFILRRLRIRPQDVQSITYRGNGWPGEIIVTTKNGETRSRIFYKTEFNPFPWKSFCFSPMSCLICSDATAELADISVGDPWLPGFNDQIGSSLIVTRTEVGEELINQAASMRIILAKPEAHESILLSQSADAIALKKRNTITRFALMKVARPKIDIALPPGFSWRPLEIADAIWIFLLRFISTVIAGSRLSAYIPTLFFRVYAKLPISFSQFLAGFIKCPKAIIDRLLHGQTRSCGKKGVRS